MRKIKLPNKVSRSLHKVGFTLRKHSPEILIGVGTVGVVASAVMACKATTKINTILENKNRETEYIHECMEKGYVVTEDNKYSQEDGKKDLTIVYTQTGLKFVKLYGPSVLLGAASLACILTSHKILRTRNIALAAAYATVDSSFKDYRKRVVERFGEELDRELKYNIKAKEVETVVTDENGETKVVKETISVPEISKFSEYARCYDETCIGWDRDAELNKSFLMMQQSFANQKLQAKGYLFLNDVYEMLGFPATRAGQAVGWVYDEKHPVGDNYVDFGIWDITKEANRNFVNGREKSIWLDFNVDGPIWDRLP